MESNKPRVLVVEDDAAIQELARMILESHATVVIAGSIHTALKELKADPNFCLVILDGRVPHFDNTPLTPSDTTHDLAWRIVNKYQIPAYSASGDDDINNKLAEIGCIRTDKYTAITEARKALIALKAKE